MNAKNVASTYGKADSQTWWSRRGTDAEHDAARLTAKRRKLDVYTAEKAASKKEGPPPEIVGGGASGSLAKLLLNAEPEDVSMTPGSPFDEEVPAPATEPPATPLPNGHAETTEPVDPSTQTVVIHPGSRWLRIGRASDLIPLSVPNVIARKCRAPVASTSTASTSQNAVEIIDHNLDEPIEALRQDFKARMRLLKLRGQMNGQQIAAQYNANNAVPELVDEIDDIQRIEWTDLTGLDDSQYFIGDDVCPFFFISS